MSRSRSRTPERYRESDRRDRGISRNYRESDHGDRTQYQERDNRNRHEDRDRRPRQYYQTYRGEDDRRVQRTEERSSYRPVRDEGRNRSRSRSTSPRRYRSLAHEDVLKTRPDNRKTATAEVSVDVDDSEADIAAFMGFEGFGSTKGEKVKGNASGGVARPPKRVEFRQYMNRAGGFNRPLDEKTAI